MDDQLIQEARRRGLMSSPQPASQEEDPLIAEAKRRGLLSSQQAPAELQQQQQRPVLSDARTPLTPPVDNKPEGGFFDQVKGTIGEIGNRFVSGEAGLDALGAVQGIPEGAYLSGKGAAKQIMKGANAISDSIVSDTTLNDFTASLERDKVQFEKDNPRGGIGRATGGILTNVGVPVGGVGTGAIKVGTAIAQGMGLGALQDAPDGESTLENTLIGGAITGAAAKIAGGLQKVAANRETIAVQANPSKIKEIAEELINKGVDTADVNQKIIQHIDDTGRLIDDKANQLYTSFAEKAAQVGKPVELINTTQRVNQALGELQNATPGFTKEMTGLQKQLTQMQATLGNSPAVDPVQLNNMRKGLNESLRALDASTQSAEIKVLKSVVKSLDSDLTTFAEANGSDIADALKTANKYYKEVSIPFYNNNLVKSLSPEALQRTPQNADKVFDRILGNNSPSLVKSLQPTDALKQQLGNKTIKDAIADSMDVASGQFNPKAFMKAITRHAEINDITFTAVQKTRLEGYKNILESMLKPSLIEETVKGVAGKVGLGGVADAAYQVGPKVLNAILSVPGAEKVLSKAAHILPNSRAMSRLLAGSIANLAKEAPKITTIHSGINNATDSFEGE